MNGKITRARRFSSLYIYMYNITTTLFFSMYIQYIPMYAETWVALTTDMYIHAHHAAHVYIHYTYIRFVRGLPRGCTLGFGGELQRVGGPVINGVATQSRPRAPSPLTQCAQGFSPSRACLSSRLVSSIYTHRKWPLPLYYIYMWTNERAGEFARCTHTRIHLNNICTYVINSKEGKQKKKIIKMIFQFTEL